jgi:hypothetical protein
MNIREQVEEMNVNTSLEAGQAVKAGYVPAGYSVVLKPMLYFMKHYFFMGGFLKGFDGLVLCSIAAMHIFVREIKIIQIKKTGTIGLPKRPPAG